MGMQMSDLTRVGSAPLEFFREVTKYFMDFLETDFHKQRLPKRAIKSRNSANLLIGFNLKKYETFQQVIENHIAANFPTETTLQIKKAQHKTKLPKNVLDLIELQISKISKADFSNFTELKGSILNMPYKNKSVESLSCLHVIEHIGLGRYGDKIDPMGSTKACKELQRVVSKKGNLFVSVPVGKEVTYFNAHRVFNPSTIFEYFDELDLVKFDAINDKGDIVHDIDPKKAAFFDYGCGLFWFTRK